MNLNWSWPNLTKDKIMLISLVHLQHASEFDVANGVTPDQYEVTHNVIFGISVSEDISSAADVIRCDHTDTHLHPLAALQYISATVTQVYAYNLQVGCTYNTVYSFWAR